MHVRCIGCNPPPLSAHLRKAWCPEASLVGGRARSGGGAPDPEYHWASRTRQGWLWALPAAVPPAGQQPPRLASYQVLLPQSHSAAEKEPAAWQRSPTPHCLLRGGSGHRWEDDRGRAGREKRVDVWYCAVDRSRFSNGTLLLKKCTNFERTVLNFTLFLCSAVFADDILIWHLIAFCFEPHKSCNFGKLLLQYCKVLKLHRSLYGAPVLSGYSVRLVKSSALGWMPFEKCLGGL